MALLCAASPAPAQDEPILLPGTGGTERFEIVEKENLRRRVDGQYAGYVYREYRGLLARNGETDDAVRYDGSFYVLEDLSMRGASARRVGDRRAASLIIGRSGVFALGDDAGYPRIRGFPSIPSAKIAVGEKWLAVGERLVDPTLSGKLTRVRFLSEYRYDGTGVYDGAEVYLVRARYALRYRAGDDPVGAGDADLLAVSGSHVAQIVLYADGSGRVFVRTQVDEQYRFADGRSVTYQGFILTWFRNAAPLDRRRTVEAVRETLESDGVSEVAVEDRPIGVAITLGSIHFVPDSPEMLPDERGRLDTLYEALNTIPDRSFLVVGHTADVGTVESQLSLSVERAKTVIDELVERGISAEKFIYTGKGGSEPVAPNDSEENRAKNRRVEIIILDR